MTDKQGAEYWIGTLGLTEHPEGGYFKETYRSEESLEASKLPARYSDGRSISTSIYFLLTDEKVSNFHRLNSDEIWHFHAGGTGRIHFISPEGDYYFREIGSAVEQGQAFQVIIPRHSWFAAEVTQGGFVLVGCTVAPGFDFGDFELAERESLVAEHPKRAELIRRFTRA